MTQKRQDTPPPLKKKSYQNNYHKNVYGDLTEKLRYGGAN